jgi:hypothetical protein
MKRNLLPLLLLVFAFPAFAQKIAEFPQLFRPGSITFDSNQLYITQEASINIYSLPDYKLIKTFGREGEGPQEFKINQNQILLVFLTPDRIVVNSLGKVSLYKKDGSFVKELKAVRGGPFMPLGDGFLGRDFTQEQGKNSITTNIYDANLTKVKEVARIEIPKRGPTIKAFPATITSVAYGDKIFTAGKKEFLISIYDLDGKPLTSITREDYQYKKITEEDKERYFSSVKARFTEPGQYEYIKKNTQFPETYPAIQQFYLADNKIYIQTYNEKDGKFEFIIYNTDGEFVKTIFIRMVRSSTGMFYPRAFHKGKFYQLIENDKSEKWELYAVEI